MNMLYECFKPMFVVFSDLIADEYTFGRGENCDVPFSSQAAKTHQCFQAYSKVHFKLIRVGQMF